MGCKVSCRRSTLESHLKTDCAFAQQIKDMDTASSKDTFNPDDYEVRSMSTVRSTQHVLHSAVNTVTAIESYCAL